MYVSAENVNLHFLSLFRLKTFEEARRQCGHNINPITNYNIDEHKNKLTSLFFVSQDKKWSATCTGRILDSNFLL